MNQSEEDNTQKAMSTQHTDDESITTSTESDSLETWTLVNDKKRNKADIKRSITLNSSITNNRIEIVATNFDDLRPDANKDTHESADSRTDDDSNLDDISEGISIISESESAGRASPLAISDTFNNADLKSFPNLDDISPASMLRLPIHIPQSSYSMPATAGPSEEKTLRQRRIKRSSSSDSPKTIVVNTKNEGLVESGMVYPLVRRGLKGLFYICATLSILAFIGKLRNPDWQPFTNVNNLSVLEQKLTDLELQNNLMRAEIDILSKQVNYLSSLNEGGRIHIDKVERQQKPQQRNFKQTGEWILKQKRKKFKTGSNSEDSLDEPMKPFKCSPEDTDGLCGEEAEAIKKNMDSYIKTIEDIPLDQIGQGKAQDSLFQKNTNKMGSKENNDEYKNGNRNSKERGSSKNIYEKQKSWKQNLKHQQQDNYKDIDDDDDDDFSDEDEDFDDSLEDFGKNKPTSKESYKNNGDNYKHRHQNAILKDRSKERRFKINSKENRYDDSAEHSQKNGEWHEKLMQQRENARRRNEFREPNKNWFIKRGDSREKMRHS